MMAYYPWKIFIFLDNAKVIDSERFGRGWNLEPKWWI